MGFKIKFFQDNKEVFKVKSKNIEKAEKDFLAFTKEKYK